MSAAGDLPEVEFPLRPLNFDDKPRSAVAAPADVHLCRQQCQIALNLASLLPNNEMVLRELEALAELLKAAGQSVYQQMEDRARQRAELVALADVPIRIPRLPMLNDDLAVPLETRIRQIQTLLAASPVFEKTDSDPLRQQEVTKALEREFGVPEDAGDDQSAALKLVRTLARVFELDIPSELPANRRGNRTDADLTAEVANKFREFRATLLKSVQRRTLDTLFQSYQKIAELDALPDRKSVV